MAEYEFDALVIAPNSMVVRLAGFVQGRCRITYPGSALTGSRFKEIFAFDGAWVDKPGMTEWLDNVRCRFDLPGKEILWLRETD